MDSDPDLKRVTFKSAKDLKKTALNQVSTAYGKKKSRYVTCSQHIQKSTP